VKRFFLLLSRLYLNGAITHPSCGVTIGYKAKGIYFYIFGRPVFLNDYMMIDVYIKLLVTQSG
jgi:hypothetical protein